MYFINYYVTNYFFSSWNYDIALYRRFHNYHQYNIPMSSKDKSGTKRKIEANKRKGN